jgi:AraC-like DNA-binding protein
MHNYHIAAKIIIISGIVINSFTAIEHITGQQRSRRSYFRFFRGIIISVLIAQLGLIGFGYHYEHPCVLFPFLTFLYLFGPLWYIRYHKFLHPGRKVPRRYIQSLLPAIPIFMMELYIQLLPYKNKHFLVQEFFRNPFEQWIIIVFFACILVLIFYSCMLLYVQIGFLKDNVLKRPLRLSILISTIFLASVLIICMYWITMNPDFVLLSDSMLSLLIVIYFLFKNRFPEFFQLLTKEIRQKRYRQSLLKNQNRNVIHERLAELMTDEKLYEDMDLRIGDVASQLMISTHQLSQLINERNKTDFRNFVNRFRIEDAKKILIEEMDRSIISICFQVGFNSKAAFNKTFKKMVGCSPKEFRENSSKQL